jgi:hypothetical protein
MVVSTVAECLDELALAHRRPAGDPDLAGPLHQVLLAADFPQWRMQEESLPYWISHIM